MTKKLPALLIFGATAPSRSNAAAMTTQLALFFKETVSVTLVISDHAAPPPAFPAGIHICRERELRADQKTYSASARLYVLGDSYESLWAFRLLQEAPGPVFIADKGLHKLLKASFETSDGWPKNYTDYLQASLGAGGEAIANALTGQRRHSAVIETEITSYDAITNYASMVAWPTDSITLPPVCKLPEKTDPTNIEDNRFLVAAVGDGITEQAAETLQKLGKDISLVLLTGAEPELAKTLDAADAICILDKTYQTPPPALSLALKSAKAIITAGQPWTRALPPGCHLPIKTQEAQHELVAALGSLLGESPVKPWLETQTQDFWATIKAEKKWAEIATTLLAQKLAPLSLVAPTQEPYVPQPQATEMCRDLLQTTDTPQPIALIGSVPPQNLLQQVFPGINLATSPRFATPQLAKLLATKTRTDQSIILARLGFESILIAPEGTSDNPKTSSNWLAVKEDLKSADRALCFECDIKGATRVHSLLPEGGDKPNSTAFDLISVVHENPVHQATDGFIEETGLYWQLNQTEHKLECLIISGLSGTYSLSLDTEDTAFVVSDVAQTSLLEKNNSAVLTTTGHGILYFALTASHPVNFYPLPCDLMLQKLAKCTFNLEWLTHG
ncbi:MAG: hypothetical protein JKY34_01445 [Kordiimonadaceae bacterium]|nr:hypothetical protein [Kordiimonadaceae bacterium]